MDQQRSSERDRLARLLGAEAAVLARADGNDATLAIIGDRVIVAEDERVALDVHVDELRRLQFDIERDRPAVLVVVPDRVTYGPQVLSIPPDEYDDIAKALVLIGRRISNRID